MRRVISLPQSARAAWESGGLASTCLSLSHPGLEEVPRLHLSLTQLFATQLREAREPGWPPPAPRLSL